MFFADALETKVMPSIDTINAIETLNFKCTASDIIAKTGSGSIDTINAELMICLRDGKGSYKIEGGEGVDTKVVYSFDENFVSNMKSRNLMLRCRFFINEVWNVVFWIFRISFGFFLLGYIVLLLVALAILLYTMNNNQRNRGNSGHNIFRGRWILGRRGVCRSFSDVLRILFFYNPFFFAPRGGMLFGRRRRRFIPFSHRNIRRNNSSHYDNNTANSNNIPPDQRTSYISNGILSRGDNLHSSTSHRVETEVDGTDHSTSNTTHTASNQRNFDETIGLITNNSGHSNEIEAVDPLRNSEELSLFEAIFSFIFGDGHPGPPENAMWMRVASLIRTHRGIIPPEILLPHLYTLPSKSLDCRFDTNVLNTSMIDCLVKFGGKPLATDDGYLVYEFQELMQQAVDHSISPSSDIVALKSFQENHWRFTYASRSQQHLSIALGIVLCIGVFIVNYVSMNISTGSQSRVYRSLQSNGVWNVVQSLNQPMAIYSVLYFVCPELADDIHYITL